MTSVPENRNSYSLSVRGGEDNNMRVNQSDGGGKKVISFPGGGILMGDGGDEKRTEPRIFFRLR